MRAVIAALAGLSLAAPARARADASVPAGDGKEWVARCQREIDALTSRVAHTRPTFGELSGSTFRSTSGTSIHTVLSTRSSTAGALSVDPCMLPCSDYPSSWTHGVETIGGLTAAYRYRAGRAHVATVYAAPGWVHAPAWFEEALVATADRCLDLEGAARPTVPQRCHAAIEAARPSLAAIDPRLGKVELMLMQGGLDGHVPGPGGPPNLTLMLWMQPCEILSCEQAPRRWTLDQPSPSERWRRSDGHYNLWVEVKLEDPAAQHRAAERLRALLDGCL
jgi:hypothetical protein